MEISKDVKYVGVNDHSIDLFEGQYEVPYGMSYNSYVVLDERTAVFDTVDKRFGDEWLRLVDGALDGRRPDYLIVQHMEPDHSANIARFVEKYPDAVIVATDKAFVMMKQFFADDYAEHRIVVKDGDTLSLGKHLLTFLTAPMVHWPEVIVTYDACEKTLFSADAFGKFGALDVEQDWTDEARRYYFGIVGKYGSQVSKLLEKAGALDLERICPLHGPVLDCDLGRYLTLYKIWASYGVESDGVFIAYTSVYGNTKEAVELLASKLREGGCPSVVVNDLARCDMSKAVENAFRYGKTVFATTTYNGDLFPFMREFLHELTERGYKNRTVGIIENGSWASTAAKKMRAILEGCAGVEILAETVSLKSALSEQSREEIDKLAKSLL